MIKLSKLTDYAVVVASQMARDTATVHTAAQIAERTGVPLPTVAKVLKLLAQGGILRSQRGAAGGYVLARPVEAISVAAIIVALDGPIALTACVDGHEGQCGVEALCPARGGWDKVNRAIRAALDQVTLADMIGTPPSDWIAPRPRPHLTSPLERA